VLKINILSRSVDTFSWSSSPLGSPGEDLGCQSDVGDKAGTSERVGDSGSVLTDSEIGAISAKGGVTGGDTGQAGDGLNDIGVYVTGQSPYPGK
jgi:hypothetical protein